MIPQLASKVNSDEALVRRGRFLTTTFLLEESERWETLWHYMQGGPGIFKGDLHFYKLDGDIRDRVAQIDTKRCPLYLLSGEYDYSCTPEETLEVAQSIPGSEVKIMEGLGHFPMSEDPRKFIQYLSPVLQKIRRTA
ncbi:hypothetical protein BH10PLA2_BH10PLA2_04570 [soil metagenome]